jgi:signal transduction histidine kinase
MLAKWLRPPRSSLLILFLLTLVSISTVSWFGWKLLEQERALAAQAAQQRLEQTADQVSANLRGSLAEMGDRLSASSAKPDGGVMLIADGDAVHVYSADRLLFQPAPTPDPEAAADLFAEGESLEFAEGQPSKAVEWYGRLAQSGNSAVRAGALLRLGRVWRTMGRVQDNAAAYARLAGISGVNVAGAPADLVGRHAVCELLGGQREAEALLTDLRQARWRLTRGQFEFYWAEASRLAGREQAPPADRMAWAQAAAQVWEARLQGQRALTVEGVPFYAMGRGSGAHRSFLIVKPDSILKQAVHGDAVAAALLDGEGRVVAGTRDPARAAAIRPASGALPWALAVSERGSNPSTLVGRERLLVVGILVMVLFLLAGTYFIARAIRKEMEISQLQSDFVAAVSHEFRTPLTSLRQLSELLLEGRVPSEARRQVYYRTLVSETERLQRLVETLLNFGGAESGSRGYRFARVDPREIVRGVIAEFAAQGRAIEWSPAGEGCVVLADAEALSVALRNLLDNALKYSPTSSKVWVECAGQDRFLAIRVRDEGAGIAPAEAKAIFEKFVRGSAAASGNVKGTGVGLATVRHIVTAHRGEVRVASEPGRGSTFTLLLPKMEAERA